MQTFTFVDLGPSQAAAVAWRGELEVLTLRVDEGLRVYVDETRPEDLSCWENIVGCLQTLFKNGFEHLKLSDDLCGEIGLENGSSVRSDPRPDYPFRFFFEEAAK